jgi:prephenate dehydratase/chorismate mutase
MSKLNELRGQIDEIDRKILELLESRASLALKTKLYKEKLQAQIGAKSVFDPSRELNILNRVSENNKCLLPVNDRKLIFKSIINACRNIQFEGDVGAGIKSNSKLSCVISVQGDLGSHSENAALTYIKNNSLDEVNRSCDILYSITSKDVLDNLCNGNAKLGILAISNSSAGVVAETLSALSVLAENDDLVKRVHVLDYVSVPVKHDLLCLKDQDINKIDAIYSHPQALAQCKEFIDTNYSNISIKKYPDTAQAARDLSLGKLPENSAVISHSNCIKHYDLKAIKSNVQDNPNNETSFIIINRI